MLGDLPGGIGFCGILCQQQPVNMRILVDEGFSFDFVGQGYVADLVFEVLQEVLCMRKIGRGDRNSLVCIVLLYLE